MDNKNLKEIYDTFTDCWRVYKRLYPPQDPEKESYWKVVYEIMQEMEYRHSSQLCKDILIAIVRDLERGCKKTTEIEKIITVLESINSNLIKISGLIEKVESAQKQ